MNERIRELKRQATIEHPAGHGIVKYEFSPEKFAELLIKECASFVESCRLVGAFEKTPEKVPEYIKQFFGVEE